MKVVTFNHEHQLYDRFKRFYISLHGYKHEPHAVLFDTGEFIYCKSNAPPDKRKEILYNGKGTGVHIVGTTDPKTMARYKFKTPDGDDVPYTHLNMRGMIDLLVDEDTGVAVGIGYVRDPDEAYALDKQARKYIPLSLRNEARAYISGPGEPPVGSPITFYPPTVWEPAFRKHVMGLVSAARAWAQLNEQQVLRGKVTPVSYADVRLRQDFSELSDELRKQLAQAGVENTRTAVTVPHLLI